MTKILEFANQAGDHVTIKLDPDSMTVTNAGEMAAAVYELVYTGDDKYHRRAKESEIADWITDGSFTGNETAGTLAKEWLEYDQEPEIDESGGA